LRSWDWSMRLEDPSGSEAGAAAVTTTCGMVVAGVSGAARAGRHRAIQEGKKDGLRSRA